MGETKPSETKPRKVVGRSVAIALGIVCVLLIASLGGAMAYYTMTINDKNNTIDSINAQLAAITGNKSNGNATEIIDQLNANITNLTNEVAQLQGWLNGNVTAYNNYVGDHSHTDEDYQSLQNQITGLESQIQSDSTEITNLQNQVASLQAPHLIEVNLKSDDNHPLFSQEYLHVYGYLCNVGTTNALNCKLHVVGYQSGGVVAFDTYIILGTINGESWTSVDGSIPYNGGSLTYWEITPQHD